MSPTASPAPAPDGSPRRALTRERILAAALRLVDEKGLEKLSMRNLGASLGVEAMSLYNHVQGKDAILHGVVETMLAELPEPDLAETDWRARLARAARALRELAMAHPKAFPLLAHRPTHAWLAVRDRVERELRLLVDSGFTPDDAVRGMRIVLRFALGFCLSDAAAMAEPRDDATAGAGASESSHPLVTRLVHTFDLPESDELFEMGLGLLIDGLEARRAAGAS